MVELAHQPTDTATLVISTDVDVGQDTTDLTVGEAGGGLGEEDGKNVGMGEEGKDLREEKKDPGIRYEYFQEVIYKIIR